MIEDDVLNEFATKVATRAANEGIPVAAIARTLQQPFDIVAEHLRGALALGQIGEMPKADWPPAARWSDRLPSVPRSMNSDDIDFAVRKAFKLSSLEAGFMTVLLKFDCANKDRLHAVVEDHRNRRPLRPDSQEQTDRKIVDVIVCKMRKKLRVAALRAGATADAYELKTSWGKGYYFEPAVKTEIFRVMGTLS